MNILIDINHPAQVHYFRNLYPTLKAKHQLIYTCKRIPIIEQLLNAYEIPYLSYGEKSNVMLYKALNQIMYDVKCLNILRNYKIDVTLGTSASNVHAALLTKAISIATTDSDLAVLPLAVRFVYPFANYIMTPDVLAFQRHKKQICYPSYQELAYLHPNRFTPDPSVLKQCGVSEGETFFILRFTAFKAHHDLGMYGLSKSQKCELIRLLETYGKVIITSEVYEPEFTSYALPVSPENLHSLLYYASMLVCDSQTMTTEAAVLGTPAFRCNTFAGRLTVIEEVEKLYDLAYSYHPRHFDWMIRKIRSLLIRNEFKSEWADKRSRLLRDKIDVTAYWIWLLENAPASLEETKNGRVDFDQYRQ